jgi:hypothetical protein
MINACAPVYSFGNGGMLEIRQMLVNKCRPANCQEVVCAVTSLVTEFTDVESKPARMPASLHKWKPPDQEFLKINVDGSFRKEDKSGACGYIVRNHLGEPVLVGAANISPVLDVLTAETMPCLFALESAQRAGI